jgi:hypothetical protein
MKRKLFTGDATDEPESMPAAKRHATEKTTRVATPWPEPDHYFMVPTLNDATFAGVVEALVALSVLAPHSTVNVLIGAALAYDDPCNRGKTTPQITMAFDAMVDAIHNSNDKAYVSLSISTTISWSSVRDTLQRAAEKTKEGSLSRDILVGFECVGRKIDTELPTLGEWTTAAGCEISMASLVGSRGQQMPNDVPNMLNDVLLTIWAVKEHLPTRGAWAELLSLLYLVCETGESFTEQSHYKGGTRDYHAEKFKRLIAVLKVRASTALDCQDGHDPNHAMDECYRDLVLPMIGRDLAATTPESEAKMLMYFMQHTKANNHPTPTHPATTTTAGISYADGSLTDRTGYPHMLATRLTNDLMGVVVAPGGQPIKIPCHARGRSHPGCGAYLVVSSEKDRTKLTNLILWMLAPLVVCLDQQTMSGYAMPHPGPTAWTLVTLLGVIPSRNKIEYITKGQVPTLEQFSGAVSGIPIDRLAVDSALACVAVTIFTDGTPAHQAARDLVRCLVSRPYQPSPPEWTVTSEDATVSVASIVSQYVDGIGAAGECTLSGHIYLHHCKMPKEKVEVDAWSTGGTGGDTIRRVLATMTWGKPTTAAVAAMFR